MIWQTSRRTFDLSRRGLIMGIVNVTEDSFSDGGRFLDPTAAVAQAARLAAEGAEIIDIGGESTRPGAEPVGEAEELRRVLPVIERLVEMRRNFNVSSSAFTVHCAAGQEDVQHPAASIQQPTGRADWKREAGAKQDAPLSTLHAQPSTFPALSIDTMKPGVARAALACGAEIVNDVTGLRDPAMREVVRASGAAAIAMHMQGEPRTMQRAPHYDDVCEEIRLFFRQIFDACLRSEIDPMRLAFDPGIGFGKTLAHNLALIRNLDGLRVCGRPLVLGVSRKSFLGKVVGSTEISDREWPTVALTSLGRTRGANVFRVHDARANTQALRMTEAILNPGPAA